MKKLFISLLLTLACAAGAWSQTVTETYRIKQMRCEDCAHKVMVAVTQDPGVSDINFNLERRTATITYDKSKTCLDSLKSRLVHTRYRLSAYDPHEVIRRGIGFHIAELSDEDKAQQISKALYRIQGVDSVAPHVDKQWVFVRYDANRTEKKTVRDCLTTLGYTPVNYYTSADISYAQFRLPANKATEQTTEAALLIDGVDDAWINKTYHTLAITYVNKNTNEAKIKEELKKAGIKVEE